MEQISESRERGQDSQLPRLPCCLHRFSSLPLANFFQHIELKSGILIPIFEWKSMVFHHHNQKVVSTEKLETLSNGGMHALGLSIDISFLLRVL